MVTTTTIYSPEPANILLMGLLNDTEEVTPPNSLKSTIRLARTIEVADEVESESRYSVQSTGYAEYPNSEFVVMTGIIDPLIADSSVSEYATELFVDTKFKSTEFVSIENIDDEESILENSLEEKIIKMDEYTGYLVTVRPTKDSYRAYFTITENANPEFKDGFHALTYLEQLADDEPFESELEIPSYTQFDMADEYTSNLLNNEALSALDETFLPTDVDDEGDEVFVLDVTEEAELLTPELSTDTTCILVNRDDVSDYPDVTSLNLDSLESYYSGALHDKFVLYCSGVPYTENNINHIESITEQIQQMSGKDLTSLNVIENREFTVLNTGFTSL